MFLIYILCWAIFLSAAVVVIIQCLLFHMPLDCCVCRMALNHLALNMAKDCTNQAIVETNSFACSAVTCKRANQRNLWIKGPLRPFLYVLDIFSGIVVVVVAQGSHKTFAEDIFINLVCILCISIKMKCFRIQWADVKHEEASYAAHDTSYIRIIHTHNWIVPAFAAFIRTGHVCGIKLWQHYLKCVSLPLLANWGREI